MTPYPTCMSPNQGEVYDFSKLKCADESKASNKTYVYLRYSLLVYNFSVLQIDIGNDTEALELPCSSLLVAT